ncbi:MAG: hypothetical protein KIT84_06375 [Labilithrix sp.]|nr:hypothetical protein [Labilithrix sp.]MCW5810618.1 hypothetical protein [Labilithrix sp.]
MLEFWLNEYTFVTFDGRVLEIFEVSGPSVKGKRAHVATLGAVTLETDRAGRVSLGVKSIKGMAVHASFVDEQQVRWAQQLVAAITAARGG